MPVVLRIFHFVSYLAFRACESLIRLLPIEWAFVVGGAGGDIAYRILYNRRSLALDNLRLAFGAEMSDTQLHALNRKHFQLLGANFLSGLKAATLPNEKIWERVTGNIPEHRADGGWIALVSHLGNWELYSHLGAKFPEYRFGAVYQTIANPFADRYMREVRAQSGIELFDRRSQLLSCVRFLREGGVVGVLIDQGAGYAGLWTPLFGRLTSSSTLAARLALRSGLPVVPIAINTCGRARWRLTISEPVFPAEDEDAEVLTAHINRLLEEQIRRAPADWLWVHNRWKPLRPHVLFARDQRPTFFPPGFDRSKLDPFRILIVSPKAAGSAEKTFAAVRAIKEGRPDTWIAVLSPAEWADSWKNNPDIAKVLTWSQRESVFALTSKIRTTAKFDVAIFFANDWKTSLAVWGARIPVRVGRRTGATSWFYNQHPAEPKEPFDPERLNLHIAQSIGANINEALIASA